MNKYILGLNIGNHDSAAALIKNGEVIDFDAKIGKRNLENIIKVKNARYLGEAALVSFDSPISNLNKVYMETLFDENASCHLALGSGSPKCFPIYDGSNIEQINSMGRNDSPIHVDFMIGTSDLNIEAVTNKGKVKIFSNGNFII